MVRGVRTAMARPNEAQLEAWRQIESALGDAMNALMNEEETTQRPLDAQLAFIATHLVQRPPATHEPDVRGNGVETEVEELRKELRTLRAELRAVGAAGDTTRSQVAALQTQVAAAAVLNGRDGHLSNRQLASSISLSISPDVTTKLQTTNLRAEQVIQALSRAERVALADEEVAHEDVSVGGLKVLAGICAMDAGTLKTRAKFPTVTVAGALQEASGKVYFEVEVVSFEGMGPAMIGWGDGSCKGDGVALGAGCDSHSWAFDTRRAQLFHTKGATGILEAKKQAAMRPFARQLAAGDCLGVAADIDTGSLWFSINGGELQPAFGPSLEPPESVPAEEREAWRACRVGPAASTPLEPLVTWTSSWALRVNFGQKKFRHQPSGFEPAFEYDPEMHKPQVQELQRGYCLKDDGTRTKANKMRRAYMLTLEEIIGPDPRQPLLECKTLSGDSFAHRLTLPGYVDAYKSIVQHPGSVVRRTEDAWLCVECINNGSIMSQQLVACNRQCAGITCAVAPRMPMCTCASQLLTRPTCSRVPPDGHSRWSFRRLLTEVALAESAAKAFAPPPTHYYRNLALLADQDWQWTTLLDADKTGFRGFTSFVPVVVSPPSCISVNREGVGGPKLCFDLTNTHYEVSVGKKKVELGDALVQFVWAPDSDTGVHKPIRLDEHNFVFPPLCLFTVIDVHEEVEWEGETFHHQLIKVIASYRGEEQAIKEVEGHEKSKMAGSVKSLHFGTRQDYIQGLDDDLLRKPVCTLREEWERDEEFQFWNVNTRRLEKTTARAEMEYVLNPVPTNTALRDKGNEGYTLEDFQSRINEHVRKHAEKNEVRMLQLTLDELIAVRLYSARLRFDPPACGEPIAHALTRCP